MKFNKNIFKLTNVMALALFLALALFGTNVNATVVNFDAVNASGGLNATSYLASYGITLTNVTPDSQGGFIYDARDAGYIIPSSNYNYFTFNGPNPYYYSYTMNFAAPVNNFSFDWVGITSPSIFPWWKATAYNASGTPLSSVGEDVWGGTRGVTNFTLNGNDIKYIIFESNAYGYAGFGSPLIDTLSYTPTPIPGALWLLGTGLLGLGAVGWRRKKV